MSWSPQQNTAINNVRRWLADRRGAQVFRLFGYAGSGKTTLAKHLAADVTGTVLYAAFTGKAALVLRRKGCEGASTIHSLIYKAITDEKTGHTEFVRNPDSAVAFASLVIIDEVSMVSEELALDLLSFGTKVLVLGDPAQLPPVKGEGYFINATPDVMLSEVHRQAADNPIIRMSMDVREGRALRPGAYGTSRVMERREVDRETLADMVLGADQLLCGTNKTRQTFNARIRELKGMKGAGAVWEPTWGDRFVCLRNNHSKGLLNGGLWQVEMEGARDSRSRFSLMVSSVDEPGAAAIDVKIHEAFFKGTEKDLDWRERRNSDEFTYGYALTVHKSQGSQWDNVLLFDESHVFRDTRRNHLYTAITRAAERVTVIV